MIVDSSALIAIVLREEGYEGVVAKLTSADAAAAGTPTLVATGIVLRARLGARADGVLERMLDEFGIQEIPFGEIHWREAVEAFRKYGRGQHRASLNFGDCMTYATAKLAGAPLLFTGDDFARTDLQPA
jgi:ribonuclease VapC